MSTRHWFAVGCRVGREATARQEFEQQGFSVYFPREMKLIRHAHQVKKSVRAFFPGYLFLHLAPDERRWTSIRSTRGASGAVHFGNRYPPLPEAAIATLKALENEEGLIGPCAQPLSSLKAGQRVVVTNGHFSGLEGIFLCKNGQQRAMVLLEMLQRQVKTGLPLAALSAA